MLPGDVDVKLLLAFDALIQTQSVSKAAAQLGIRQPAMSAALARLRELFGDELFVRASGAMQPTPKAARLAAPVADVLARLRAVLSDHIGFDPRAARQTFTLASTDYVTFVLGPALYADLAASAPGVDLRIVGYDKNDVPERIDRGELDVALGVFPDPPERAVRQPLYEERFVGLARRGHPALVDGEMSLAAYCAASHALVSVRRDTRGVIDAVLADLGRARRIALTLPHMLALQDIIVRTDLIAALPERVARRAAPEALVVFELPLEVPAWTVEMLWNAAARTDPPTAWLRSRILETARRVDERRPQDRGRPRARSRHPVTP
jgi:DNA-binding transcriptional LysR family regulator